MKPEITILTWLKLSAKIFTCFCLIGSGFLGGYLSGKIYQAEKDKLFLNNLRHNADSIIHVRDSLLIKQDSLIQKLYDWKSVLFEGTKKEVAEKIKAEKKNRLNHKYYE